MEGKDTVNKTDEANFESKKDYRSILENIKEGYYEVDLSGNFTFVNTSLCEMLGYKKDELLEMNYKDYTDRETSKKMYEIFNDVFWSGEAIKVYDWEIVTKDGSRYSHEGSVSLMRNSNGDAIGFHGIVRDITARKYEEAALRETKDELERLVEERTAELITSNVKLKMEIEERKRTEEALAASEKKYRTILDSTLDGCMELDLGGTALYANKSACDHMGYSYEEFIGLNYKKYMTKETANKVYAIFNEVYSTGEPAKLVEYEAKAKDGKLIQVEAHVTLMRDPSGKPNGFRTFSRVINERKQAEEERLKIEAQLQQAQKMEAIGTLAGGVAHDFSNLLTTIIGNADLALMQVGNDNPVQEELEEIKKASDRAASLTRQLLAFSRKQVIQPRVLNLNRLLTEIEKMLGRLIGENIEVSMIQEPLLWHVEVDPSQLEQVILNLAVNSRDAMPRGGKLIIETKNVQLDKKFFHDQGVEEKPGSYVMLSVKDNGIGIDKKNQQRIFEPFYTTKEVDKGTGLGLSTVYGIVKQNNGFIWVDSEPGHGTTFNIFLPRIDRKEHIKDDTKISTDELSGNETILIVEDYEMLRKLLRITLSKYGYKVLEAKNGEEAIEICNTHVGPIHLMITDVVMPKMGGKQAADRIEPLYPKMKVIYMSGYTDDTISHHGVLEPGLNFIEKPFKNEQLVYKVRELLDDIQN